MIFRQLVTPDTGCASYVLGCPRAAACAVVDPQEDIAPHPEMAAREPLRITHVIETHVQADHRSGARRLASVTRAPVFPAAAAVAAIVAPAGPSSVPTASSSMASPGMAATRGT
ncbi:MAG: MBL fold metallo-hydrolase [Candidatus Rokubacteria bacterium]|nr:MBL fold metallo-hydrolase [Candidatus Rokubacteria bacterium]MBI3105493.1 MBL fold metallo-hydrolase [Candidatus Rokubacteria bacterium]